LRQLGLIGVFGATLYLVGTLALDRVLLIEGLRRIEIWQWAVLSALSLFNYGLRYWRWDKYIRRETPDSVNRCLTTRVHVLIYFAGFALTVTPGKAGEALRCVYLREHGIPWRRSLAVLVVERLLDLFTLALLALGYVKVFVGGWGYGALLIISLISIIVLLRSRVLYGWLLPRLIGNRRYGKIGAVLDEVRLLVSPKLFGFGLLVGLFAWGAEAFGFMLLLGWMGFALGVIESSGIYAGSLIAGALSFMPGGLGGAEASMIALLKIQGASLSIALLVTLICRLVTLWFAVALGLVAIVILERHLKSLKFG
jgi:uncharacterized membrane protein YbhN (UPF0104 family)